MRWACAGIITSLLIFGAVSGARAFASTPHLPATQDNARGVDRNMERVAQRLYKSALKFYYDRAYWKAARELIILLDYYPSFSDADGVLCHLGESLYSMDMFKSSHKMFRFLVTKFPQSEYVPQGLYGLQRIQYQAENYAESLKIYDALVANYPNTDLMNGIHYFGGMAYFHLHNYDKAIAILSQIGSRSEYYDYGLYTIGLAQLKKKNINQALSALRKVIAQPLYRMEQREVKGQAHLTLGFIYYELAYYNEAISHMRHIGPDHKDYPQALLTRSWASIKMNDFQSAIVTLNELIKKFDATEYGEEAHFLLGQSYLRLEFYDFAIQQYDYIIAQYPEANNVAERVRQVSAGLREQESLLEKLKVRLLVLESKLIDSIYLDGSKQIPKYIQDHSDQLAKSKDQLIEQILSERKTFEEVSQNLEQVRSDIARRESRRHWGAYAEYGKTRALFLKGMPK